MTAARRVLGSPVLRGSLLALAVVAAMAAAAGAL